MGEQEAKNNSVTNAQAYNYLAKGATTSALPEERKNTAWLSKAQASAIPCTYIEKDLAKEAIGIELPKRKVNTYEAAGIEVSYFVTNKGDIFTWPPYYKSDDGLFYVNDTIPVAGSKVTSGEWLISGDDEKEMYKDGFAFMVNGVEIKILGTGENVLEIGPDTPVEEIRTMASIAYKDERNAKSPEGVKFEGEFAVGEGNNNGGANGGQDDGNEGENQEELNPSGTIPAGAYYANLATGTFYQEMPATVTEGDAYLYGDYIYTYYVDFYGREGWDVSLATEEILYYIPNYPVIDKYQSSYGIILESINGLRVTRIDGTFIGCSNLITPPQLPNGIRTMAQAFNYCTSLIDLSGFVIPNGVEDIHEAFVGCSALRTAPIIPSSVTEIEKAFFNCSSLTGIITVNAQEFDYYYDCFANVDMSQITLAGSCPANIKQELANTGLNGDRVTIIN